MYIYMIILELMIKRMCSLVDMVIVFSNNTENTTSGVMTVLAIPSGIYVKLDMKRNQDSML